jgi:para-nitrobenzyl esterase
VWRYLFSWRPPLVGRRIGSGHGMELPFVFGTLRDGILRRTLGASRSRAAPVAADARCVDRVCAQRRARSCEAPEWGAYDTRERATLEFDREPALIHAPFAASPRLAAAPRLSPPTVL